MQKVNFAKSLEEKTLSLRDFIRSTSKGEIAVIRDAFASHGQDLTVEPATPVSTMEQDVSPEEAKSQLPPMSSLTADSDDILNLKIGRSDLREIMQKSLPFGDDFTLWNAMKYENSEVVLLEYLQKSIPGETKITTSDDTYVKAIIDLVSTEGFRQSHGIPRPGTPEDMMTSFPLVPKKILRVLQEIVILARERSDYIDIESFWKQVRALFANSAIEEHVARTVDKPTATTLLNQGLAAVAEEDQTALMKQFLSAESYALYLSNKEKHKGEMLTEVSENVGTVSAAIQALDESNLMDSTQIGLRSRTVNAQVTHVQTTSGGHVTRRRMHESTSATDIEKKKTKK